MDNVTAPFVVRRIAGAIGAEIRGAKLSPDLPMGLLPRCAAYGSSILCCFSTTRN